eukprot:c14467_g1_i1 orf=995-1189(+)
MKQMHVFLELLKGSYALCNEKLAIQRCLVILLEGNLFCGISVLLWKGEDLGMQLSVCAAALLQV